MTRQPGREVLRSPGEVHNRQGHEHDGKYDESDDEWFPIGHDPRLAYSQPRESDRTRTIRAARGSLLRTRARATIDTVTIGVDGSIGGEGLGRTEARSGSDALVHGKRGRAGGVT